MTLVNLQTLDFKGKKKRKRSKKKKRKENCRLLYLIANTMPIIYKLLLGMHPSITQDKTPMPYKSLIAPIGGIYHPNAQNGILRSPIGILVGSLTPKKGLNDIYSIRV